LDHPIGVAVKLIGAEGAVISLLTSAVVYLRGVEKRPAAVLLNAIICQ